MSSNVESSPVLSPVTSMEIASQPLRDGRHILMVVAHVSPEGWLLDAGTWQIAAGQFIRPRQPLALCPETLPAARRLAELAAQTAPHAIYDEADGMAVLGRNGELTVTAGRAPDGSTWVALAWVNGSGVAGVPLAEIGVLKKVLVEAEEELCRLGLIGASSLTH